MTKVLSGWFSKYFSKHTYKLWSKQAVSENEVWVKKKRRYWEGRYEQKHNTGVSLHSETYISVEITQRKGTEQGQRARCVVVVVGWIRATIDSQSVWHAIVELMRETELCKITFWRVDALFLWSTFIETKACFYNSEKQGNAAFHKYVDCLTPRSRVFLENLMGLRLVKNFIRILWNLEVDRRIYNSPPSAPPESYQYSPCLTSHFLKIYFNIIVSYTHRSSKCSLFLKFCNQNSSPLCHITRLSISLFDGPNNP
jgi:hypothetical protein